MKLFFNQNQQNINKNLRIYNKLVKDNNNNNWRE